MTLFLLTAQPVGTPELVFDIMQYCMHGTAIASNGAGTHDDHDY
jgi:hypothetical protein